MQPTLLQSFVQKEKGFA